jgi:hypothetical protein
MGSIEDLIDYQEGRGEILDFQVGKGSKMRLSESLRSSEESSYQQGMLTCDREAEERPHLYEESCGFVAHVNEDDEKLNNSTIKEEDQRCILIIGGIKIFLPSSQTEASICVSDAAEEGKPTETVIKEEMEQILKFSHVREEEDNSEGWLKIFSQEDEQEMTAALETASEEEADSINFVDLCEELEALERRVIVQSMHIQNARLETGEGAYQSKEQLEETGDMPAEELT